MGGVMAEQYTSFLLSALWVHLLLKQQLKKVPFLLLTACTVATTSRQPKPDPELETAVSA
jgi:hypothetical protein